MSKRIVLTLIPVILAMVVGLAGMPASAADATINTTGTTPFLYAGQSYLPLRSVATFLGAPLRWDAEKGQAVLSYNGDDLALTPGNVNALFKGQPVALTSPPVVVGGNTYLPTAALKQCYNVPAAWDKARSEVKIKGPSGWGTVRVNNRPPWHGGPPPWAPAWGARRKQAGVHQPLVPGKGQHQQVGKPKAQRK